MSVNTESKRRAIVNVSSPWRGMLPKPDGGFAIAGDRGQLAYHYLYLAAAVEPDTRSVSGRASALQSLAGGGSNSIGVSGRGSSSQSITGRKPN